MSDPTEIRHALEIAAKALDIASDWGLPEIQIHPPKEWKLEAADAESARDGWCTTNALADKLRELAK